MGTRRESFEEFLHVLVDHAVVSQLSPELLQLFGRWQFTIQKQPGRFDKIRFLGQLLDGVTPVSQNTSIAINIGDGARRPRYC